MSLESDVENLFRKQPIWEPSALYEALSCYRNKDVVKSVLFDLVLRDRVTVRGGWLPGEERLLHGLFGRDGNASPADEPPDEEEESEMRGWIVRELEGMFRRQDRWRPDQILSHFDAEPWNTTSDEVSSAIADLIFDGRLRVDYRDGPGKLLHLVAADPWPPRPEPSPGEQIQKLREKNAALEQELDEERKRYHVMKWAFGSVAFRGLGPDAGPKASWAPGTWSSGPGSPATNVASWGSPRAAASRRAVPSRRARPVRRPARGRWRTLSPRGRSSTW